MKDILTYLFWPNPGNAAYSSPKAFLLLIGCGVLICVSLGIRGWRKRMKNPVTRKLSASWASAALSFGVIGLLLVVSRVEGIQFLAMRFLWVLWVGFAVLFLVFQARQYRTRHYDVLPRISVNDPREKYLPGKRKR